MFLNDNDRDYDVLVRKSGKVTMEIKNKVIESSDQ